MPIAPSADATRSHADSLNQKITRLVAGPRHPSRSFVVSGYSYRELYGLAESIRREVDEQNAVLCLFTEDKAWVAAALLAALTGKFSVILPYAGSVAAIEEIGRNVRLSAVVADRETGFPGALKVLTPVPYKGELPERIPATEPDEPFLKFFTGGSTGKPRMWAKTPRNLFAEAFFHAQKYRITPEDRILTTVQIGRASCRERVCHRV